MTCSQLIVNNSDEVASRESSRARLISTKTTSPERLRRTRNLLSGSGKSVLKTTNGVSGWKFTWNVWENPWFFNGNLFIKFQRYAIYIISLKTYLFWCFKGENCLLKAFVCLIARMHVPKLLCCKCFSRRRNNSHCAYIEHKIFLTDSTTKKTLSLFWSAESNSWVHTANWKTLAKNLSNI